MIKRGKSLLGSKTFWLNLLGATASIASIGIIPPKYSIPILAIANILNRIATGVPITSILPKED